MALSLKTKSHVSSDTAGETSHTETSHVGTTLKARRIAYGLDIVEVAQVIRIRASYLEAIEDGRFGELPGVPYVIGFVRTYAAHLGLSGDEMVARFKAEAAGLERRPTLAFPSMAPEGKVPGNGPLLVAIVVAAGIAGAWLFLRDDIGQLLERLPENPIRSLQSPRTPTPSVATTEPPPATVADVAPPPANPPANSAVVPPPSVVAGTPPAAQSNTPPPPGALSATPVPVVPPKPPGAATTPNGVPTMAPVVAPPPGAFNSSSQSASDGEETATPPPTGLSPNAAQLPNQAEPAPAAAPPPPPQPPVPPDAKTFGALTGDVRILLKAKGDSWIQMRDPGNQAVFTRVLKNGDVYRVPVQQGLTLMTGNAGALDVVVDGTVVPSLGGIGIVRRKVLMEPDRLKAGTAIAE